MLVEYEKTASFSLRFQILFIDKICKFCWHKKIDLRINFNCIYNNGKLNLVKKILSFLL